MAAPTAKKLPDERKSVTEEMLDHSEDLYRHKKRPEWGVAILAWEKEGRRAYQFEDGRLRKFQEGYYSLMEPVEKVKRPREAVVSGLEEAIEANRGAAPPQALEPVAPFEAQVELFRELYPGGFADEDWIADHRGDTSGRALKRHRDPAVHEVHEKLSKARCEELLSADRHDALTESVTDILGGTSLVPLKHVKVLRGMEEEERRAFAESVVEILHGEGDYGARYKAHLELLTQIFDGRPSWRIATALPALMYPQEQVCVRRSAFARQAAAIAPLAKYSKRARYVSYKNFRRVAFAVQTRLQAEDLEPRDLLDVHDFIWATLRNAALDHLG